MAMKASILVVTSGYGLAGRRFTHAAGQRGAAWPGNRLKVVRHRNPGQPS